MSVKVSSFGNKMTATVTDDAGRVIGTITRRGKPDAFRYWAFDHSNRRLAADLPTVSEAAKYVEDAAQ